MSARLYLRQDVKAEPLLRAWYAVSLCVPPASGAMFVANSHVKIMKSYILSPEMHAAAARDPAMKGGPFMSYADNRVAEIRALLDRTLAQSRPVLELAEAIRVVDELLRKEAKGFSLEPLYPKIPDVLQGYVELAYDLTNQPSFRFVEHLLYRSRYYERASQAVGLSRVEGDHRPFVLSTPRLEDAQYMHLNIPFDDPRLDELFMLKESPRPFGEIKELLGVETVRSELFRSFLTEEPQQAAQDRNYAGNAVRVRYFGHACLLIESKNTRILTDPLVSYAYASAVPRFTFADLPDVIDYVLITHAHLDHVVIETLLQLRHRVRNVIVPRNGGGSLQDPSLKLLLLNLGFKSVIALDEFETVAVEGGHIMSLPFLGEHHDLGIRSRTAYRVCLESRTLCIAADCCNLEEKIFEGVYSECGPTDVLFVGMECDGAPLSWFYGPLLCRRLDREMDASRQGSASNCRRASAMTASLRCKRAYVYAMGLEPWLEFIMSIDWNKDSPRITESNRFIEDCRRQGLEAQLLSGQKTIML